ncbi:hypothetical protein WJX77_008497, partial [Trebouxia sp. C0004]
TVEERTGVTGEVAAGVAKDKVDAGEVGVEVGIAVGVAVVVMSGVIIGVAAGVAAEVTWRSTGGLTRELGGIVVEEGVIVEVAAAETVAPGETEGIVPEIGLEPAALPEDGLEAGGTMPLVGVAVEVLPEAMGLAEMVFGKVPETKGVPAELKRGMFEVNSADAGLGDSVAEGFAPGTAMAGVGFGDNVEAEGALDSAAGLTAAATVELPEVPDAFVP